MMKDKLNEKKASLKRIVVVSTVVGLAVTTVVLTRENRELRRAVETAGEVLAKAGLQLEVHAVPITAP